MSTARRLVHLVHRVPLVHLVRLALALAAIGGSASLHAQAAVVEKKGAEAVVPPADRPAGRAPDATPGSAMAPDGGPLLRCWQYGRLILEEPIGAGTVSVPGVALQLRARAEGRNVQVLDLKTATCVIR